MPKPRKIKEIKVKLSTGQVEIVTLHEVDLILADTAVLTTLSTSNSPAHGDGKIGQRYSESTKNVIVRAGRASAFNAKYNNPAAAQSKS